jgi:hypothetical protein
MVRVHTPIDVQEMIRGQVKIKPKTVPGFIFSRIMSGTMVWA